MTSGGFSNCGFRNAQGVPGDSLGGTAGLGTQ